MSQEEPRIKRVKCGICDQAFTNATIPEIAQQVASHWNEEHGDELAHSETPFKTEEYGGEHMHGDQYIYRVKKYYITAYDVLDDSGASCGPFAYEYVKQPESQDVCEDCWRPIKSVDGYRELSTDGWRNKYLCDECHHERQVEKHREENESLTAFADGGRDIPGEEEA